MRKYLFLLLMLPMAVAAQTNTFGYFRYKKVVEQLPEYSQVCNDYEELKKQCDAEIARNEEQLTRSYVAYLDGQNEFPEPILRKRQKELQELVDKSILFRKELQAWLTAAHDSLYAPLRAKVDDAVSRVCLHNNLAYIIDLDEAGYKFINPTCGFDITNALLGTLGIIVPEQATPAEGEQTTEGEEQQTQTQTQTQQTVVEEGNVVKEGE